MIRRLKILLKYQMIYSKSQLNDAIIFMLDFEDKLFEKVNIETEQKRH